MDSETIVLMIYFLILFVQIAGTVFAARKNKFLFWALVYVFEILSVVGAIIAMLYFDRRPGYGILPGLSYFSETIYSLCAALVYGVSIVNTAIVNIIFAMIRAAKRRSANRQL